MASGTSRHRAARVRARRSVAAPRRATSNGARAIGYTGRHRTLQSGGWTFSAEVRRQGRSLRFKVPAPGRRAKSRQRVARGRNDAISQCLAPSGDPARAPTGRSLANQIVPDREALSNP